MHGAGPASNDKAHPVDVYVATSFALHGAVVVSINYADAATDAASAIDWVLLHADEHRLDIDRVVVAGVSAGAIGATRLAYESDDARVDAVVAYAGVGTASTFEEGDPPAFVVHGTFDEAVPVERARDFCAAASASGVACELTEYPTDHAGIFAHATDIESRTSVWLHDALALGPPDPTPDTTPDTTVPSAEDPTTTDTTRPPLVLETPHPFPAPPRVPSTTPRFAG